MSSNTSLLMSKGVAVWLIDNTGMTFEQIAYVCKMHPLQVQNIADDDSSTMPLACNPLVTGEISEEEIQKCANDPNYMPKINTIDIKKNKKSGSYTPIARRRAKPDAILWLLRHSPLSHAQIVKLIGTTKNTVKAIHEGTYWNMKNLKPRDPVLLRLCLSTQLEDAILSAKIARDKEESFKRAMMVEDAKIAQSEDS